MNTDNELLQKRIELKQIINDGIKRTFPAYFYDVIGNGFVKLFRLPKKPHWGFSAFVFIVLLLLPGSFIALVTGEIYRWGKIELILHGTAILAYFCGITSFVNLKYIILPGIRDHIVDAIQSKESLYKFEKWLSSMFSISNWLIITIGFGFLYGLLVTILEFYAFGRLLSVSIIVSTFLIGTTPTMALYVVARMLTFPIELANYQLHIYELDPANSEVIQRLIYTLNVYIYIIVGYCASGTMIFALIPKMSWGIWLFITLGWAPTIIQFLVNQYAIRKIIINAKWQNLNRLQIRISELQNNILTDASDKAILQLNQLMDLHDRISKKPNSALSWGAGLSFLNQLMLPLLGLLLGNIDKLLALLKP